MFTYRHRPLIPRMLSATDLFRRQRRRGGDTFLQAVGLRGNVHVVSHCRRRIGHGKPSPVRSKLSPRPVIGMGLSHTSDSAYWERQARQRSVSSEHVFACNTTYLLFRSCDISAEGGHLRLKHACCFRGDVSWLVVSVAVSLRPLYSELLTESGLRWRLSWLLLLFDSAGQAVLHGKRILRC